jgi:hypothetical protein
MGSLDKFLARLLHEGRIVFRQRPAPASSTAAAKEKAQAAEVLERAYAAYRLDVAGPPIPFDAEVACAAGELVRRASWALIDHGERVEDLGRRVVMPHGPRGPSDHLSADLVLRFLPQVARRARAIDPSDRLLGLLSGVLRQWPLSGVLADLDEGPSTPLDLGEHPGLLLLYAERWARHGRAAWRPAGRALDYVELVLRDGPAGAGRSAHG